MMRRLANALLDYALNAVVLHVTWNLLMASSFNLPHAKFLQVYSLVVFGNVILTSITYFIRKDKERYER